MSKSALIYQLCMILPLKRRIAPICCLKPKKDNSDVIRYRLGLGGGDRGGSRSRGRGGGERGR